MAQDAKQAEEEPLKGAQDAATEAATNVTNMAAKLVKSRSKGDMARMNDYVSMLKDNISDDNFKKGVRCFCKYGLTPLLTIFYFYVWLGRKAYEIYKVLPTNVITILFGLLLCFFGGAYFALIGAVEAAINMGGADLWIHLGIVWEEGSKVGKASLEDDKVDADGNGIEDVQEMGMQQLIQHKSKLALVAVKDPARLQAALLSLMNLYIAVIATLKSEFARTVAIALGVAGMLALPAARVVGPLLAGVLGKDLNHWVPTIISVTIKIIAVAIASFIQQIISGFYSGLRGGRLVAGGVINILSEKGLMEKFPDWLASKPFDPDKSYLDELIAWPLFAYGFYRQISTAFHPAPFPVSILLWPADWIEWKIRWDVFT